MDSTFKYIPMNVILRWFKRGDDMRDVATLTVMIHALSTEGRIYAPTAKELGKALKCKPRKAEKLMDIIENYPEYFSRSRGHITVSGLKKASHRSHVSKNGKSVLWTRAGMLFDYDRPMTYRQVRAMLEEYIAVYIDEAYSHRTESVRLNATYKLSTTLIPTFSEVRNMPRHIKLARIIGKNRSTATRLYQRLERKGLVRINHGHSVAVLDIAHGGIVLNSSENANDRWGFLAKDGIWRVRIPDTRDVLNSPTRVRRFFMQRSRKVRAAGENQRSRRLSLNTMCNPNITQERFR